MSQVYQRDKMQEKKIKHYLCVRANYDIFFVIKQIGFDLHVYKTNFL